MNTLRVKSYRRTLVFVLSGLCSAYGGRAQSVYSQWLSKSGGSAAESAVAIAPALAEATNVYVLGGYSTSNTIGGVTLNNPGGLQNIFLTKFLFQSDGAPLWTKTPVSDGAVSNASVIADYNGDVYIAGSFAGTNLAFETTILTNYGTHSDDVFIAKYNTYGTLQWLRHLGGSSSDTFAGLDGGQFFSANGFYVSGAFQSSTFSAGGTTISRQGTGTDCFTASYDLNGNLLWIKQGSNARSTCLSADAANNCYLGGQLLGAALFDTHSPANQTGTNFLAKYDPSGNLQWVRGDVVVGGLLKVDAAHNIYTAGTFSNALTVGSITLSSQAASTIFAAKYDPSGNLLWAIQVPGKGNDYVSGITLDTRTNCWLSGYFASANQGGQPVSPIAFMAVLRPNGKVHIFEQGNGAGASVATAMGTLYNQFLGVPGDAFVCGSFSTNFTLGNLSVTNNGVSDVFAGWFISPPELSTVETETNLVVSWPVAGSQYFSLQAATDLGFGNWAAPTNPIYYVNGQFVITNSTLSGSAFFRLKSH